MKRLKYTCLFGGKRYPFFVTGALVLMVTFTTLFHDFSVHAMLAAVLFTAASSLLVCWLIENIPTDEEREIIADSEFPVWDYAGETLRAAVTDRTKLPGRTACILALTSCCIAFAFFAPKHSDPDPAAALRSFLLAGAILLLDWLSRLFWRIRLDDSAQYAVILIDHTYDVSFNSKRGRWFDWADAELTSSYMVFYLPDGRYILPIPHTSGRFNAVAVVRCHGMLRWTPVFQDGTEIQPV